MLWATRVKQKYEPAFLYSPFHSSISGHRKLRVVEFSYKNQLCIKRWFGMELMLTTGETQVTILMPL